MRRASLVFVLCVAILGATAVSSAQAPALRAASGLPVLTRSAIELSKNSTVHLLVRGKGGRGAWFGLCTASKISATELVSAEHCFAEAMAHALPANQCPASNYVATSSEEYAVADPERISQPILRITGISLARLSDLALITVSPHRSPATADDRRKWRKVAVLPYALADSAPKPSTAAVVTSYPLGKDGRFHKVTYFGSFVSREANNAGAPLQDTIALTTTPTGACRPGASGSRLIFANGTASGALTSELHGLCSFSVLTDRTLRGLRTGLHHLAIPQPPAPPPLEPLPDPTLTAASFDGLSFRFHFGGQPGKYLQADGSCPAGSVSFGGVGGIFGIDRVVASAGGWTPVNDSKNNYYGEAVSDDGAVVGIGIVLEIQSDADGSGILGLDIGCPVTALRTLPASGEFESSWVNGTVSGGFQVCASYAYAHRPDAYDIYVTATLHAC